MDYKWETSALPKSNGLTVYSTFSCGGGSSFGYKLAGFEVVGANDIDVRMRDVYLLNHHPLRYDLCSVGDLVNNPMEVDILDGSPPCSSFSSAGERESGWSKKKRFREGQSKQVLSDLFFEFLDVAKVWQPKVIVAENVKGMLLGNARAYTKLVLEKFLEIGYDVQLFLVNCEQLGVPQLRKRVFFIARRKDLGFKPLKLNFNEPVVTFGEVSDRCDPKTDVYTPLSNIYQKYWSQVGPGQSMGKFKTKRINRKDTPSFTITANGFLAHPDSPRELSKQELCMCGTFPMDYNFGVEQPKYVIGMSVPPMAMYKISNEIYQQWFK